MLRDEVGRPSSVYRRQVVRLCVGDRGSKYLSFFAKATRIVDSSLA